MTKKKVPLFEGNLTYWETVCVGLGWSAPSEAPKAPFTHSTHPFTELISCRYVELLVFTKNC